MIVEKIGHLPVLEKEPSGRYPPSQPVEIGELTLAAMTDRDTRFGRQHQTTPEERRLLYAVGRTPDGNILVGASVTNETGLVEDPIEPLHAIDYSPIRLYPN